MSDLQIARITPFFLLLLFASTTGPLLFGYHLAELNAPQDVLRCERKSPAAPSKTSSLPDCIPLNVPQFGFVSSAFTVGGLVGALSAGSPSSKYGRLLTMRFCTLFSISGPIVEALSFNMTTISFGRFISGIGAGSSLVVAPIYISEVSPPEKRGFFGAFTQVMINIGVFIAQVLGMFLSKGQLWRLILVAAGFIGTLQSLALLFAVESPRWMAGKGQTTNAMKTLRRIRGLDYDTKAEVEAWGLHVPNHEQREEERALLAEHAGEEPPAYDASHSVTVSILEIVSDPESRRAVIGVVGVMIAQQFLGINSIIMYGVNLLSDVLAASSALLLVFVAVVNILVTLLCAPLLDRLGRKTCLVPSMIGMGISSFFLAIAIMRSMPVLSAVTVITFVSSFGLGLGPVPFMLSSELVCPEASGAAQSWALAANWTSTFVISMFFPILNESLGKGRVYFIFAALAAVFAVFVAYWIPETKGKKDADEVWGRKKHSTNS